MQGIRMPKKVELGQMVKDTITGYEGIVIARLEQLHSCTRIQVQHLGLSEGVPMQAQYFDEPRLEITNGEQKVGFKSPE